MSTTSIFYPDSATRVSYCLIILSAVLPFGLASSGWIRMALGSGSAGGLAGLVMTPLLLIGLYRVFTVIRSGEVLCAPIATGIAGITRKLGILLIYFGGLVSVLGLFAGPLMVTLVKHKTESGAEFFVMGVFLALVGRVGWIGIFLFEASRLMSFERFFRIGKSEGSAAADTKKVGDFRDTFPMPPNQ